MPETYEDTLRRHLLAASLGAEPKFDPVLADMGRGIAGLFDTFCNRKLAWSAADEHLVTGDRSHVVLPRYPVKDVTAVEVRDSDADDWVSCSEDILSLHRPSGLLRFAAELGTELTQVRVSYSGGYWFSELEPDDDGYPEAAPAGATAVPGDLLGAFLLQCEQVWQVHDRLGSGIVGGEGGQFLNTRLSTLDLLPQVKAMLQKFIRYQLS